MSTQESSERTRRRREKKMKTTTIFQFILIELYKEPHTNNCVFIITMRCCEKFIDEKKTETKFPSRTQKKYKSNQLK